MEKEDKRYAFISYNHQDAKWAEWLQKKLESYKLPQGIHNKFEDSKFLRPVFRDKTDLNTGVLADELRMELEKSEFLIVICSPNSAKSAWVSDEVKAFIEMGRLDHIIPFVVDGIPHNYLEKDPRDIEIDECYPYFLRLYTKEHSETELLGISIKEVGKEKAFMRVVSKMLGVSFDVLWKRHERQLKISRMLTGAFVLFLSLIIGGIWYYNQPFDTNISIMENPLYDNLPFVDGKIEVYLDNEVISDTVTDVKGSFNFHNIPSKYKNKEVRVTYSGYGFESVDTLIKLTSNMVLIIHRNPLTYGHVVGYVYDNNDIPIKGVKVKILDVETLSNELGYFKVEIPLEMQVSSSIGYNATVEYHNESSESRVYPQGDNNIINTLYIE